MCWVNNKEINLKWGREGSKRKNMGVWEEKICMQFPWVTEEHQKIIGKER